MSHDLNININIDEILGDVPAQYLPIDKLITGKNQARQSKVKVSEDSKLVDQIRKVGGLLQPIIVKKLKDETYEIIVGQRRTGAYRILSKEDDKFKKIKAYVITKDLSQDEIKVISFIENYGRDDMDKADYVNVIEYFYQKYGKIAGAAKALGISPNDAKKYLTHARLSDKVKECIARKEFTIDTAMKALKALGDDEDSVDEDMLIETARELKKLKPAKRNKVVKKMQSGTPLKTAIKIQQSTTTLNIDITDDQLDRLETYKSKYGYENKEDAATEALDVALLQDLT